MEYNIVNYAEENMDTFARRAFCPVDSLILSWLSYLRIPGDAPEFRDWEGLPLSSLYRAEWFDKLFLGVWDPESSRRLLTALAASPRFRNLRVMGYTEQMDPEAEKQFSAVTFRLTEGLSYVAFRGTDASFVGWKEDFNMAFQTVPSQETAVAYLARAALYCPGRLMTGGHSKGGNLAVYAAACCDEAVQGRILRIYSHDGPGFLAEMLTSPGFQAIADRVEKTLPQSSVVGMLLEDQESFQLVKSGRVSFWQHDPFSWQVEGDRFCPADHLTADAHYLDKTLNDWVRGLAQEERERFVDALYGILNVNEVTTFAQWQDQRQKNLSDTMKAASQMDPDTRKFLGHTLKELAALSVKHFPELWAKEEKEKKEP